MARRFLQLDLLSRIIFSVSCLYALYIIALYPLFLNALAKRWPRPVERASRIPTVSMILATHNGAAFLKDKLDSIFALDYPSDALQLIVVDDGSTDTTRNVLAAEGRNFDTLALEHAGKAVALNHGIAVARGEILVFTDVRQRLAADSLRLLMENFADPSVGAVSAELHIENGSSRAEENVGAYWRYERWIRLNLSTLDSNFGSTGSYYAIRRELAVPIPPHTLVDDMYVPLHAFFKGYRLVVDARARMFDYPTTLSSEFGRKVRTLAGNYQMLRAYPQLLSSRNRLWWHFVSYKFGRLLLPFALIAASISSLLAGGLLAKISLIAQLGILAGVVIDPVLPEKMFLRRVTSPIRTFAVMMLAACCAASIWFVPAERLWRTTRVVRTGPAI